MSRCFTLLALALVALLAAAVPTAGAKQTGGPTVRSYSPDKPELGGKLALLGKGFAKQNKRNTVVLRAPNGGSTFLKPTSAAKRKLVMRLRNKIERLMVEKAGVAVATRFRVRVLAGKKFGPWTKKKRSPVIRPTGSGAGGGAAGDCDGDGSPNGTDDDDDNDLLPDTVEKEIKTDGCLVDTDGDGLGDGFEYESALNLNNDEDQEPNTSLPYPGKRPYPNPLDPSDIGKDFDGDSLTLAEEYSLWKYAIENGYAVRTLNPLYYSDGEQYSINERVQGDRRRPALLAAGYDKQVNFLNWASNNGYRSVLLDDGPPWWAHEVVRHSYGLLDFNRDGIESDTPPAGYWRSETLYYDAIVPDGYLDDGERDEDADGLTNGDESHRRLSAAWWTAQCYTGEKVFQIAYEGTDLVDPDSDGDGVRDGADDQDHDDLPNVMELSRNAASGYDDTDGRECKPDDDVGTGNFKVTGGPLPNSAVTVTFEGELGRLDVPQMTATGSLTGGSAPAVSVNTVRQGSSTGDEQQTVTITGGPTGGSFTLTFNGQTTAAIGFDADLAGVEGALDTIFPADANTNHPNVFGRVNPFNPCLPATWSRTCPRIVSVDTGAPFDDSLNWAALN